MEKFILSLGTILFGLAVGQGLKAFETRRRGRPAEETPRYVVWLRDGVFLGVNPLVVLGAFWGASLNDLKLVSLPFLGLLAILLGGGLALLFSRIYRHDGRQKGAMYGSGSFTNLGMVGGIVCYAFLGEASLAYVFMYKFLEELYYFLVGFPAAKAFGRQEKSGEKRSFLKIFADLYISVGLSAIALGIILNISGIIRPFFYAGLNSVLVPLVTAALACSVGYTLRFSKIRSYLKECLTVAAIKFIVTPAVVISAAWALGLGAVENGLALKAVCILSAMPPAFYSVVTPKLYGLDRDLANSCWLFCTGLLVIVVPVLSFFFI